MMAGGHDGSHRRSARGRTCLPQLISLSSPAVSSELTVRTECISAFVHLQQDGLREGGDSWEALRGRSSPGHQLLEGIVLDGSSGTSCCVLASGR